MITYLRTIGADVFEFLYPVSCLVCGDRLRDASHICTHCLEYAFEQANPDGRESCDGLIIPEWIVMQDSLWEFDKGGYLQDVLHHVKYSGLSDLGRTLGRQLGLKLKINRFFTVDNETLLLPVPLHPSRQRKRGYNQSAVIAEGISKITGSEIVDESVIKRIKNTRTQTGLSAGVRKKNIAKAFQLHDPDMFHDARVLVVDDVITTGATMLELAGVIRPYCGHIGFATIARA